MNGTVNTELPDGFIRVLDKGYVGYVDHMGSDLSVTNAARASFDKTSTEWSDKEERLLKFLIREEHTSPLRHAVMSVEIYAPLIIARQWWKHVVASAHLDDQVAHNESSRRYITETPEFYVVQPDEWRSAPENRKQGSGPVIESLSSDDFYELTAKYFRSPPEGTYTGIDSTPSSEEMRLEQMQYGNYFTKQLGATYAQGLRNYDDAIERGIAPEQARLFLPAYGLYVRWRWTFSLGAGLHFLHQRLAHDAQSEIRMFAEAVRDILAVHFPNAVASLELS